MIRTVIFDMDGVLVDTEPLHREAFFRHYAELGLTISDEEYATFLGASTRNVYQQLKQEFNLAGDVEELMKRKRELFAAAFDESTDLDLLPGARELILELRAAGVPLQLASSASKDTIHRVFRRFELYPLFDNLVSGEDFPRSKPDPAIFLHAAKLAGVPPQECLVIEDSSNGVKAAKAAGMYCIGFSSEHSTGQNLDHADMVVSSLTQLDAKMITALSVPSTSGS
jgi:HAD superfamily hydrolase (TIGR01509 family)